MNTEKNKRTEDILNSLDGTQRAAAPDFFYTRLKARMEKELTSGKNRSWVIRPAYAFAALTLVLLVNALVLFQNDEAVPDNGTDTDYAQSVAADYSLNDNSIYDLNEDKE
jgi:hypothetical protein